jgi:hypothetical protein
MAIEIVDLPIENGGSFPALNAALFKRSRLVDLSQCVCRVWVETSQISHGLDASHGLPFSKETYYCSMNSRIDIAQYCTEFVIEAILNYIVY